MRPADLATGETAEWSGAREQRRAGRQLGFLQIGEKLIRRVDRRRLITGQVKEPQSPMRSRKASRVWAVRFVAVGDNIADEIAILIEGWLQSTPQVPIETARASGKRSRASSRR